MTFSLISILSSKDIYCLEDTDEKQFLTYQCIINKIAFPCFVSLQSVLAPNNCGLRKAMWYRRKLVPFRPQVTLETNLSFVFISPLYFIFISLKSFNNCCIISNFIQVCFTFPIWTRFLKATLHIWFTLLSPSLPSKTIRLRGRRT